jgi:DNA polymerase-3 subunit epsilon
MVLRSIRVALDRRRHRDSRWNDLFEPYQGDEVVSLDCETSGLDPRRDAIISVGAVRIDGCRIGTSEALDLTLAPPERLDPESVKVHKLRRQDLHGGLPVDEAMAQVLEFVGNRPLLGYNVAFDIAIIDRHIQPLFGFRLPNRTIELADVYLRRWNRPDSGLEADLRLETIARNLGLPVPRGRHTALKDAVFTAALYVRMMHGERPT